MVLTNNFKNVIMKETRKNYLAIIQLSNYKTTRSPTSLRSRGFDSKLNLTAWVQTETYQGLPRTQPQFAEVRHH